MEDGKKRKMKTKEQRKQKKKMKGERLNESK